MKTSGHLDPDLLIRAVDEELTDADRAGVEAHLSDCADCSARYHELAVLSVRLESLVAAVPAHASSDLRNSLQDQMTSLGLTSAKHPRAPLVSWRVGWGMAIAAALALGLVFLPHRHDGFTNATASSAASPGTFEVEGETFVSLPFSNSDLPLSAPRIVRMQMPLSSLADAGLVFEPASYEAARPDPAVLADVLLGADGEPLGVHVVANE